MSTSAGSPLSPSRPAPVSSVTTGSQSCHICGEARGPIVEVYAYTFVCRRCHADDKLGGALVRWNRQLDRERQQ